MVDNQQKPQPVPAPTFKDDEQVTIEQFEEAARKKYGIPKNLLQAMVEQESNNGQNLTSPTGVKGKYQVTEAVAKQYGLNRDDPFEQAAAAMRYLREQYDDLKDVKDENERWLGAVGRYYGGPEAVKDGKADYISRDNISNPVEHLSRVAGNWRKLGLDGASPFEQQPAPAAPIAPEKIDLSADDPAPPLKIETSVPATGPSEDVVPGTAPVSPRANMFTAAGVRDINNLGGAAPDSRMAASRKAIRFNRNDAKRFEQNTADDTRWKMIVGAFVNSLPAEERSYMAQVMDRMRQMDPEGFDAQVAQAMQQARLRDVDPKIATWARKGDKELTLIIPSEYRRLSSALKAGGPAAFDAEYKKIQDERAGYKQEQEDKKRAEQEQIKGIREQFVRDPGKVAAFGDIAGSQLESKLRGIAGGAAGLLSGLTEQFGMDGLDRSLVEFSDRQQRIQQAIDEEQQKSQQKSGLGSFGAAGARMAGALPVDLTAASINPAAVFLTSLAESARDEPTKAIVSSYRNALTAGLGAGIIKQGGVLNVMKGLGQETLLNGLSSAPDVAHAALQASNLKKNPKATPEQIAQANTNLERAVADTSINLIFGALMSGSHALASKVAEGRNLRQSQNYNGAAELYNSLDEATRAQIEQSILSGDEHPLITDMLWTKTLEQAEAEGINADAIRMAMKAQENISQKRAALGGLPVQVNPETQLQYQRVMELSALNRAQFMVEGLSALGVEPLSGREAAPLATYTDEIAKSIQEVAPDIPIDLSQPGATVRTQDAATIADRLMDTANPDAIELGIRLKFKAGEAMRQGLGMVGLFNVEGQDPGYSAWHEQFHPQQEKFIERPIRERAKEESQLVLDDYDLLKRFEEGEGAIKAEALREKSARSVADVRYVAQDRPQYVTAAGEQIQKNRAIYDPEARDTSLYNLIGNGRTASELQARFRKGLEDEGYFSDPATAGIEQVYEPLAKLGDKEFLRRNNISNLEAEALAIAELRALNVDSDAVRALANHLPVAQRKAFLEFLDNRTTDKYKGINENQTAKETQAVPDRPAPADTAPEGRAASEEPVPVIPPQRDEQPAPQRPVEAETRRGPEPPREEAAQPGKLEEKPAPAAEPRQESQLNESRNTESAVTAEQVESLASKGTNTRAKSEPEMLRKKIAELGELAKQPRNEINQGKINSIGRTLVGYYGLETSTVKDWVLEVQGLKDADVKVPTPVTDSIVSSNERLQEKSQTFEQPSLIPGEPSRTVKSTYSPEVTAAMASAERLYKLHGQLPDGRAIQYLKGQGVDVNDFVRRLQGLEAPKTPEHLPTPAPEPKNVATGLETPRNDTSNTVTRENVKVGDRIWDNQSQRYGKVTKVGTAGVSLVLEDRPGESRPKPLTTDSKYSMLSKERPSDVINRSQTSAEPVKPQGEPVNTSSRSRQQNAELLDKYPIDSRVPIEMRPEIRELLSEADAVLNYHDDLDNTTLPAQERNLYDLRQSLANAARNGYYPTGVNLWLPQIREALQEFRRQSPSRRTPTDTTQQSRPVSEPAPAQQGGKPEIPSNLLSEVNNIRTQFRAGKIKPGETITLSNGVKVKMPSEANKVSRIVENGLAQEVEGAGVFGKSAQRIHKHWIASKDKVTAALDKFGLIREGMEPDSKAGRDLLHRALLKMYDNPRVAPEKIGQMVLDDVNSGKSLKDVERVGTRLSDIPASDLYGRLKSKQLEYILPDDLKSIGEEVHRGKRKGVVSLYNRRLKEASEEASASTQRAITTGSYKKITEDIRRIAPTAKSVLDYGAGLGLGTDALRDGLPAHRVDSFEPFPGKWKGKTAPTYTDASDIAQKYDVVTSANVLNVLKKPLRDDVIKDIYDKINPGGTGIVITRGWSGDISPQKGTLGSEPKSKITADGVYQKGWDGNELVEYLKEVIPDAKIEKYTGAGKNGAVIRKPEEGVALYNRKQQETPQFKEWFKDSKVVDGNGKPLTVYHGTINNFEVFNTKPTSREPGAHFGTAKAANQFVSLPKSFRTGGDNVLPVYLSIKNPVEVTDVFGWGPAKLAKNLFDRKVITEADFNKLDFTAPEKAMTDLINSLKDKGYDGFKYTNRTEDAGSTSWVVFDPAQIKSATGNRGTFDTNNPNILYNRTPKKASDKSIEHPNEALNGKKMLKRLPDGRVVVPNAENKTGVSIVKDRAFREADSWDTSTPLYNRARVSPKEHIKSRIGAMYTEERYKTIPEHEKSKVKRLFHEAEAAWNRGDDKKFAEKLYTATKAEDVLIGKTKSTAVKAAETGIKLAQLSMLTDPVSRSMDITASNLNIHAQNAINPLRRAAAWIADSYLAPKAAASKSAQENIRNKFITDTSFRKVAPKLKTTDWLTGSAKGYAEGTKEFFELFTKPYSDFQLATGMSYNIDRLQSGWKPVDEFGNRAFAAVANAPDSFARMAMYEIVSRQFARQYAEGFPVNQRQAKFKEFYNNIPEEVAGTIIQLVERYTFNSPNRAAETVYSFIDTYAPKQHKELAKALAGAIFQFVKVKTNVAKQGIRYAAGPVMLAYDVNNLWHALYDSYDPKTGKFGLSAAERRMRLDLLTDSAVGSILMANLALGALSGYNAYVKENVGGSYSDSDKEEVTFDEARGLKPGSATVAGRILEPGMLGNFQRRMQFDKDVLRGFGKQGVDKDTGKLKESTTGDKVAAAADATYKQIKEFPLATITGDLLESKFTSSGSLSRNLANRTVPGIVKFGGRFLDDKQRVARKDDFWTSYKDNVKNLSGFGKDLPEKVDAAGEPVYKRSFLGRDKRESEGMKELDRLGLRLPAHPVKEKGSMYTMQEQSDKAKYLGQNIKKVIDKVQGSKIYRNLKTDEEKAQLLNDIIQDVNRNPELTPEEATHNAQIAVKYLSIREEMRNDPFYKKIPVSQRQYAERYMKDQLDKFAVNKELKEKTEGDIDLDDLYDQFYDVVSDKDGLRELMQAALERAAEKKPLPFERKKN